MPLYASVFGNFPFAASSQPYFHQDIIVFIDDILVSLKITIGFFRFFPV